MIAAWSAHQPATSSRHIIREKTKRRSPGCSEARCGSVLWCQARLARRVGGRHRLRRASHRTADARTSFACQAASAQPAQGRRPEVDDRADYARPGVPRRTAQPALDRRIRFADLRFTYIWTAEGRLYVAAVIDRLPPGGGLVDEGRDDRRVRDRRTDDGDLAPGKAGCPAASLRPGQPVCQRAVPEAHDRQRHHLLDEPLRQCLGQCRDGELVRCFARPFGSRR